MVQWDSRKDGVLLSTLFNKGVTDQRFTKVADIDPIQEMEEKFKSFLLLSFVIAARLQPLTG